ncbi:MAG: HTH domain-containing protein [Actinomycetota bacterium]
MTDDLSRVRERTRAEVQAALAAAQTDLADLDERRRRLQEEIDAAHAWLGTPEHNGDTGRLSLHEAMALVLRENGNQGMRAPELATEINRRDLYRMRNGSPAGAHQIHARVHNYPDMFVRVEGTIRLKGA